MTKRLRRLLSKVPPSVGVLAVALGGVTLFVAAHMMSVEQVTADVQFTDRYETREPSPLRRDETKIVTADLDGPVPRQAERMREASGLALVIGYARISEFINKRPAPASVDALLEVVMREGLLPPGVSLPAAEDRKPGVLAGRHATIYVRYRVEPFGVEVVSVGNTKDDGAAILIRLPYEPDKDDPTASAGKDNPGAALFVCDTTGTITVPPPFASPATVLKAGWQPDKFRALDIPQEQVNELNDWVRKYDTGR
jgi:hypothetical protein